MVPKRKVGVCAYFRHTLSAELLTKRSRVVTLPRMSAEAQTEELRASLTDEERERLLRELDPDARPPLSAEQWEQLGVVWRATNAIPSPALILAAPMRTDNDRHVVARFIAYDLAPRRAPVAAGWFVSGYLSRLPSGEFVVRQLAIEPEHAGQMGITGDVLRSINVTQIVAKVRAYLLAAPDAAVVLDEHLSEDAVQALAAGVELAAQLPTRRGRTMEELERFALVCLEEFDLRGRGWFERVVEREDRPRETLRDWLRAAKRGGWLAPGLPG